MKKAFHKKNDPVNIVLNHHQYKACYTRHDFGGKDQWSIVKEACSVIY